MVAGWGYGRACRHALAAVGLLPGLGGLAAGAASSPPWLSEAESEAGLGSAYPKTGDAKEFLPSCAQKSCLVLYRLMGREKRGKATE